MATVKSILYSFAEDVDSVVLKKTIGIEFDPHWELNTFNLAAD